MYKIGTDILEQVRDHAKNVNSFLAWQLQFRPDGRMTKNEREIFVEGKNLLQLLEDNYQINPFGHKVIKKRILKK